MEKLISQIEVDEGRKIVSKYVIKSEVKSMKKVSKLFRTLQILKYNTKSITYKFIKRTVDICAGWRSGVRWRSSGGSIVNEKDIV